MVPAHGKDMADMGLSDPDVTGPQAIPEAWRGAELEPSPSCADCGLSLASQWHEQGAVCFLSFQEGCL